MIFHNCRKIEWDLIEPESVKDYEADVIDFVLGEKSYEKQATFYTDIFELSVFYGKLEIIKSWWYCNALKLGNYDNFVKE